MTKKMRRSSGGNHLPFLGMLILLVTASKAFCLGRFPFPAPGLPSPFRATA